MADESDFNVEATPSLQQLAEYLITAFFDVHNLARLEIAIGNAIQKGSTVADASKFQAGHDLGATLEDTYEFAKDKAERALAAGLGKIASEVLGVEVSASDMFNARLGPEGSAIGAAIATVALRGIGGDSALAEPSDEGAKRLLGMIAHMITHCWAEGIVLEKIEGYTSWAGHIEEISKLAIDLVNGLGLSRVARTALRPLVRAAISIPMEWKVNRERRPTLLGAGDIVRAFLRGDYSADEAAEELARLGYSDRRQDMLIKNSQQRLSTGDVMALVREGTLDRDFAEQNLRDQGFDQDTAHLQIIAEDTKRSRSILDDSLGAIVSAFVNRDLDEAGFRTLLPAIIPDEAEQGFHDTAARTKRDLNIKHMSQGEVLECVELAIVPQSFYRDWLAREGYPEDEATALELRMIAKLQKNADIHAERERIATEKKLAKQKADVDKAAKIAAAEQQAALARRGSIADLTRAFVRGLIALARLQEVLQTHYDPDTVQILSDAAVAQRAAFVKQQHAADDAAKRNAHRSLDLGAAQAAYFENVITIQDFRARLDLAGYSAADADVLTATLVARKQDVDNAQKKRDEAAAAAQRRSIDLGRAEELVIRGHGTLAQYDALLGSLGYDDASRAAMKDLLQLKIDDYAKAQKTRADADAKKNIHDVTAADLHRGVVLGTRTVDDYQAYLVKNGFTADAIALLVANAKQDAAEALAARQRRAAADATRVGATLSLARVARAVQLGIVTPDAYQQRLVKAGYSPDDIAIDMDLLVVEIADAKRKQQRAGDLTTQAADRGLSLQQLAAAVKAGAASIEDYRGRAAALGYAAADVELLVSVLQGELDQQADADARRTTISGELAARQLSLAQLEDAVGKNLRTLEQFRQQLVQWGYGSDDAQILASLLGTKLAAQQAKGTSG